tara:strand:- start:5412 stop:5942 length:531 start_codon:yes stop_codon:yes gene_type:complete
MSLGKISGFNYGVQTPQLPLSAIEYAQSIAGGMPFSQVVQPGMSFSPQFPMRDRVIPPSPGLPPVTPPSVPPNMPPVGVGPGMGGYGSGGSSRFRDIYDYGNISYDQMDFDQPGGPMPFDTGKSAGPLDFMSLLPPQQPSAMGLPPIQPPSQQLPDLSGGLMNTIPSDLGKVLSLI